MILTISQDHQRPRAHRRRGQEDRVQGDERRERQARARALLRHGARVAGLAQRILRMALDSFARLDVSAAVEIVDFDDELDAAFGSILRQLISYMMEDPRTISASIEIVFMAKSIERIGDHAKNIAEAVVQAVKGTDVRHQSRGRDPRGRRSRRDADDPGRRGRAGDPRAPEVNLADAGYDVRPRADAEAAKAVLKGRCPTSCCSTGCCPASRASRSRASCAPTRARASCRSSW